MRGFCRSKNEVADGFMMDDDKEMRIVERRAGDSC